MGRQSCSIRRVQASADAAASLNIFFSTTIASGSATKETEMKEPHNIRTTGVNAVSITAKFKASLAVKATLIAFALAAAAPLTSLDVGGDRSA
jgi:hypothetical protein